MLPPHIIVFSAIEGALVDSTGRVSPEAEDAVRRLERRGVPLVLVTGGTRAELEPIRKKIGHGHPFITEHGGGTFLPDGYFPMHVAGSEREGRYFLVPLASPRAEAIERLQALSKETGVEVMGFHQMSAREIARNTGLSSGQAERAREREFEEPFFFAGATEAAIRRFVEAARKGGATLTRGEPFWRISLGADPARAVRDLSRHFRTALRTRLSMAGIAARSEDASWMKAVDQPIVLSLHAGEFDPELTAQLTRARRILQPGGAGWAEAITSLLSD